jgi:biuret amidohydrolase
MRVETIVLNGGFMDCCILNTRLTPAITISASSWRATSCAGPTTIWENAALAMVSLHIGLVADCADILSEWKRRGAGLSAP